MADYSGIYKHYQGTTSQCNYLQQIREIVWDSTSGLLRFKDCDSNIHYIANASGVEGVPGYYALFDGTNSIDSGFLKQNGRNLTVDNSGVVVTFMSGNVLRFTPNNLGSAVAQAYATGLYFYLETPGSQIGESLYIRNRASSGAVIIENGHYGVTITGAGGVSIDGNSGNGVGLVGGNISITSQDNSWGHIYLDAAADLDMEGRDMLADFRDINLTATRNTNIFGDTRLNCNIRASGLPTSSSGLATDYLWVDTGAGNVIKRV